MNNADKTEATETKTLEMLRSDLGDGGWSIGYEDPSGDQDRYRIVLSGEATMVDGEWDRPNAADLAQARKIAGVA